MEKEDTISVQWAQEDVETSCSLLNSNNNNNVEGKRRRGRRRRDVLEVIIIR